MLQTDSFGKSHIASAVDAQKSNGLSTNDEQSMWKKIVDEFEALSRTVEQTTDRMNELNSYLKRNYSILKEFYQDENGQIYDATIARVSSAYSSLGMSQCVSLAQASVVVHNLKDKIQRQSEKLKNCSSTEQRKSLEAKKIVWERALKTLEAFLQEEFALLQSIEKKKELEGAYLNVLAQPLYQKEKKKLIVKAMHILRYPKNKESKDLDWAKQYMIKIKHEMTKALQTQVDLGSTSAQFLSIRDRLLKPLNSLTQEEIERILRKEVLGANGLFTKEGEFDRESFDQFIKELKLKEVSSHLDEAKQKFQEKLFASIPKFQKFLEDPDISSEYKIDLDGILGTLKKNVLNVKAVIKKITHPKFEEALGKLNKKISALTDIASDFQDNIDKYLKWSDGRANLKDFQKASDNLTEYIKELKSIKETYGDLISFYEKKSKKPKLFHESKEEFNREIEAAELKLKHLKSTFSSVKNRAEGQKIRTKLNALIDGVNRLLTSPNPDFLALEQQLQVIENKWKLAIKDKDKKISQLREETKESEIEELQEGYRELATKYILCQEKGLNASMARVRQLLQSNQQLRSGELNSQAKLLIKKNNEELKQIASSRMIATYGTRLKGHLETLIKEWSEYSQNIEQKLSVLEQNSPEKKSQIDALKRLKDETQKKVTRLYTNLDRTSTTYQQFLEEMQSRKTRSK